MAMESFHIFDTQHRSVDKNYGITAFTFFVVAIVGHGCMLIAHLLALTQASQDFNKRAQRPDWRSVLLGIALPLAINIPLIIRFWNWRGQFQSNNDVLRCEACIAASTLGISCLIIF